MGWFNRRPAEPEARAISFADWSTDGVAAVRVTGMDSALRLAPVYAAVRLIADQAASLPMHGYRQAGAARELLPQQPSLLSGPSQRVSAFTWKQQALVSLLLRGNAFGLITSRSKSGFARNVEWLNPDAVNVDESAGAPRYFWGGVALDSADVVHVTGLTLPGSCVGVAPMSAFRTVIEAGLQAQQFTRDWFVNGGPIGPGSHLQNTERTLSPDQADAVKQRYRAAVQTGDVLVTGSDWSLQSLTVKADDAAFVESSRLTATQIASVYGVPPEMVGGQSGSSLTYSTVELNSLNFVTYSLRPWLVRLEEAVSALLPAPQFARFNVDALLRADTKSRYEAHAIALGAGFLSVNEVRALEDRPPLLPGEGESHVIA